MRTTVVDEGKVHMMTAVNQLVDPTLGSHFVRIGHYCRAIAAELGLPADQQQLMLRAAPMHDVGKISVPHSILSKPGPLTAGEYNVVKGHTRVCHRLLSGHRSPTIQSAATIALTHHERFDGTGYPSGLKGDEIPLIGRICAVGDVFDALTSERPYKRAWPVHAAVNEIAVTSGRHFDPNIVAAFFNALPEILRLKERFSDRAYGTLFAKPARPALSAS
jgi:putative two-component system response regulator